MTERPVRCAIYTRKSTDKGLDEAFNTLVAQREAAEAYIQSQKAFGWCILPSHYDDGGFSGGSLERPAFKRLIEDAKNREIDVIVVYKVDRFSRSLLDFAQVMAILDEHGVALVSVTQHFNTGSSMGRLMLNVLLSFAQFERETIAERISDKMAAARRKGKYVGGIPPLGYDVNRKQLVINEAEAAQVRQIFESYLKHKSMMRVLAEMKEKGWTTKAWTNRNGQHRPGKTFNKNSLHKLLTNIMYIGQINYKGKIYPGEQAAIVEESIWKQAQEILNSNYFGGEDRYDSEALLLGLLRCDACDCPMTHTYTVKNKMRYRYYVCTKAKREGYEICPYKSLPAGDLETFVVTQIKCLSQDEALARLVITEAKEKNENEQLKLQAELDQANKNLVEQQKTLADLLSLKPQSSTERGTIAADVARYGNQIRLFEEQARSLWEQLQQVTTSALNEEEAKEAFRAFDPVWQEIPAKERQQLLRLLIERIDCRDNSITITFQASGIQSLIDKAEEGEKA
jgi:site-specific DNA recombinase